MSKILPRALMASFLLPAAALLGGCETQTSNTGELLPQSAEVQSNITVTEGKYKSINDQIKTMETALQALTEKSRFIGYYTDHGLLYAINPDDFGVVTNLQTDLGRTHTAILNLLADKNLNPDGRFTPGLIELSGSIGDTQKSMGNLYRIGGSGDWWAPADVMEDVRRLYNEAQAVRADIASVANPKPAPKPAVENTLEP